MGDVAVVIPTINEEKVLGNTLKSLISQIEPGDIFVISSGSTDSTIKIAKSFKVNYTSTKNKNGKTKNLRLAIEKFGILKKYKYVLFLDADTRPLNRFFKIILEKFETPGIACVCGQVITENKPNILIAFRAFIYFVWQNYYKWVCSLFNAITIAPGTASVYTTRALSKIDFDENIIIEDFDMTFQVHRKHLGRIVYEPKAKIVTQDPDNLGDYYKQIVRWNLGFIQSVIKHRVPLGWQAFDFALLILVLNEIIHSIFVVTITIVSVWLVFALYPNFLGYYMVPKIIWSVFIFDIWLTFGFSLLQILISKRFYYLLYIPFLWFIQFINFVATVKALYLAIFKSINGTWTSPQRH